MKQYTSMGPYSSTPAWDHTAAHQHETIQQYTSMGPTAVQQASTPHCTSIAQLSPPPRTHVHGCTSHQTPLPPSPICTPPPPPSLMCTPPHPPPMYTTPLSHLCARPPYPHPTPPMYTTPNPPCPHTYVHEPPPTPPPHLCTRRQTRPARSCCRFPVGPAGFPAASALTSTFALCARPANTWVCMSGQRGVQRVCVCVYVCVMSHGQHTHGYLQED